MQRSVDDVKNWMNMFRWIVKLIRDDFQIEEARLTRTAALETDLGLSAEQIEDIIGTISEAFAMRFPDNTLDEVLKLEELCMVASWIKGLYKKPEFISGDFEAKCRAANPAMAA
jgi:acyl carrier protein